MDNLRREKAISNRADVLSAVVIVQDGEREVPEGTPRGCVGISCKVDVIDQTADSAMTSIALYVDSG